MSLRVSGASGVELSVRSPASIFKFLAAPRGTRIVIRDSDNPAYDFFKLLCRETSHIGRDGPEGPTWLGVKGHRWVAPPSSETKPFRIVSFHTDDRLYTAAATRLKASADALSLPICIETVRAVSSWERHCSFKAEFVREQWHRSDVPVVWLDADATVKRFPKLFSVLDADFAAFKRGWSMKAGTLYFGKSAGAEALLTEWVDRCRADPDQWDQISLDLAWAAVASQSPLRTSWLPETYCWKFDKPDESDSAVIVQWQASRNMEKKERSPKSKRPFVRARRASRTKVQIR